MNLNNFLSSFKEAAPVLLLIFLVVLVSIILTRIILRIILLFAIKKYQAIAKKIEESKPVKAEKVIPKTDDEKFVEKEEFKQELVEKMNVKEESPELEETKIVELVKPVGFWTSVILGQKLTYLLSSAKIMNDNSDKGFWTSMVEAQERAQGRQKGRSL
ncbi:MAG: hypothetical protein ACJAW3_001495 [Lentimonas sp.]|jgi:hypothetical protein